jgi:hypothetical protein
VDRLKKAPGRARVAYTRQFSTTIPLMPKERGGSSIERKGVKQFSTTKPLKPLIHNDKFKIIVNSTENRINFVNNQSILLLPSYINNYSDFIYKFNIICSKLNKEKYKFILKFYFDVKFYNEATDLLICAFNIIYSRINAKEFVQSMKLTEGYVEVCLIELYPDILSELDNYIEILSKLDYYIDLLSQDADINLSSEVLLIIEAVKKPASAADMIAVAVDYSEPKRLVAYGSSVTKGRSTTINNCPITIRNHVGLASNLRHFRVMPKIIFSTQAREACIREFSTTKPLIPKEVKSFNNGYVSSIFVNSSINNLNFVNNKSILLLPCLGDYSKLERSISIVCSSYARFVTQATEPLELPPPQAKASWWGQGSDTKLI